jgi:HAD superfamily hydrolase (TIGR01662 family)
VLFDRDGTLIVDVPYNGDPARVVPMPGARAALDRLRAAGVRVGVVSNQSGIARGLLTRAQVEAVNARM